jgi:hypothetical protein
MEIKKVKSNKKTLKKDGVYEKRLTNLVDLVIKKIIVCKSMYPEIERFKRSKALNAELFKSINRFMSLPIKKTEKKPTTNINEPAGLVIGRNYKYMPDSKTNSAYSEAHAGRIVKLIAFRQNGPTGARDSDFWKECVYKVEFSVPYQNVVYFFWTRKECLKKTNY